MPRYLAALLFAASLLFSTGAQATCNGQFPANTVCGNPTGSTGNPNPVPLSSFSSSITVGNPVIGGTNSYLLGISSGGNLASQQFATLAQGGLGGDQSAATAGQFPIYPGSGGAAVPTSPAAITKTNDTNVTLTLGGSASTALVNPASFALGWTGYLGLSRGGLGGSQAAATAGQIPVYPGSGGAAIPTSGVLIIPGTASTYFGFNAGNPNLVANTGVNNTGFGNTTLFANTTGFDNAAFGEQTLYQNTTGIQNTAIGQGALYSNINGSFNTAVGQTALSSNTSGDYNTALGQQALNNSTTGIQNTAVGATPMYFNTTGSRNVAMGYQALQANTTGVDNTALGTNALLGATTASNNTAIGSAVLDSTTTGYNNTAVGAGAMITNTTGYENVAVGQIALSNNSTGYENAAFGTSALRAVTVGHDDVGIGNYSLLNLTTGIFNTAVGSQTGYGITTGSYNTIIGAQVQGLSATLANNIILSDGAGNIRAQYNAGWIFAGSVAISSTLTSAAQTITSASANAFAVGLNGATNPAFNVNAATASQVAGLNVSGAVTGGTVAVSVTDSGSNANLSINAKGSGTIGIGTVSTGSVTITPALNLPFVSGTQCLHSVSGVVGGTGGDCLPTSIANNTMLANTSGSTGTPIATTATTWFDKAFCNTVGYLVVRTTGAWVCSKSFPANVQWFGAVGDGTTNDTTDIKNAIATGSPVYLPTASVCYLVSSDLTMTVPGQIMYGDGRTPSQICVKAAGGFTYGVIYMNPTGGGNTLNSAPAEQLRDFGISFAQTNSSSRSSLTNYPPAIYTQGTRYWKVTRVRISEAMVGIDARNSSGGNIDDLEMSAFSVGLWINQEFDIVRIHGLHLSFFGADMASDTCGVGSSNTGLCAILGAQANMSSTSTACTPQTTSGSGPPIGILADGEADGIFVSDSLLFFGMNLCAVNTTGAPKGSWWEISTTGFDTYSGVYMDDVSQVMNISSSYFSPFVYDASQAIVVNAGQLTCSSCWVYSGAPTSSATPIIELRGSGDGVINLNNSQLFVTLNNPMIDTPSATGGTIMISNVFFSVDGSLTLTYPAIRSRSGTRLTFQGNRANDNPNGNTFIKVDVDDWHNVVGNVSPGWINSCPSTQSTMISALNNSSSTPSNSTCN